MTAPPRTEPLRLGELLGTDYDPTQYKLHCACREHGRGGSTGDLRTRGLGFMDLVEQIPAAEERIQPAPDLLRHAGPACV